MQKNNKGHTMDTYEYSKMLETLSIKMNNIRDIIKPSVMQNEIIEMENQLQSPKFWNA